MALVGLVVLHGSKGPDCGEIVWPVFYGDPVRDRLHPVLMILLCVGCGVSEVATSQESGAYISVRSEVPTLTTASLSTLSPR
jgi:hypothetical protein